MAIEAVDWSVVVVGAWNLAILTPDGIRKRLFNLPEGSAVDIEVAIDRPGAFRVRHDGVVVEPTPIALTITGEANDLESLGNACQVAMKALKGLPETPVSAVGINCKYQVPEMPNAVIDLLECGLDDVLSDGSHSIIGKSLRRAIACQDGVLNFEIAQGEDSSGIVGFNFHLGSLDVNSLTNWLAKSHEFCDITNTMLSQIGFVDGDKK